MLKKVNPSHPDKVADRIAGAIVEVARNYINKIGIFEKFAEWGLIR